jgi:hypothetical protein
VGPAVHGIVSRPEVNGSVGQSLGLHNPKEPKTSRVLVRLLATEDSAKRKPQAIKVSNLRPCDAPPGGDPPPDVWTHSRPTSSSGARAEDGGGEWLPWPRVHELVHNEVRSGGVGSGFVGIVAAGFRAAIEVSRAASASLEGNLVWDNRGQAVGRWREDDSETPEAASEEGTAEGADRDTTGGLSEEDVNMMRMAVGEESAQQMIWERVAERARPDGAVAFCGNVFRDNAGYNGAMPQELAAPSPQAAAAQKKIDDDERRRDEKRCAEEQTPASRSSEELQRNLLANVLMDEIYRTLRDQQRQANLMKEQGGDRALLMSFMMSSIEEPHSEAAADAGEKDHPYAIASCILLKKLDARAALASPARGKFKKLLRAARSIDATAREFDIMSLFHEDAQQPQASLVNLVTTSDEALAALFLKSLYRVSDTFLALEIDATDEASVTRMSQQARLASTEVWMSIAPAWFGMASPEAAGNLSALMAKMV